MPAYTDDLNIFSAVVGQEDTQTDTGAGGTGETFAIEKGQGIVIHVDGLMYLASAESGSEMLPCVGIATKRLFHDEVGTFAVRGKVRGVTPALDMGEKVYLSNTAGAFSKTAGDTSQVVGRCFAATDEFLFDPVTDGADNYTEES